MSLAFPWLLALLPLPLLLRRLLPPLAVPRPALALPAHLLAGARPAGAARMHGSWLAGLAWIALVLALAGPRIEVASDVIPASGRDIVLVIDLSGSMLKEDFLLDDQPVTRLEAVKRTASAFVAARRGDRIGLVIFGERAYFAAPLTFDVDAVARAIDEAQIGISGRGTAISDGLGLAAKRLSRSDAPTRVIVLLSDGVDTSGTVPAVEAARLAHDHGIRVHSIALGPEDLENQPQSRDAVDVATLRAVAEVAGGESFRVRDTADLQAVAASLDRLEPNPSARPPMRLWQPLWVWPAALAALCLFLIAGRRRGWTG
ncbi:VWA domain-containing protein [Paracoccus aerius]|uniref:VWA domain-containing protein n=1 Tax=Paracoccus aerius TaxID=1915382 RepID=A0ABS1S1Z5_9RHOB|nr:VWA domain-containing protein [Paracoccus aerius]MBL3672738.1 VWA domain-containing protein [Paracoccus aerius]GHG14968.1 VWA domain-containing protein [Paracoccus aerius]